MAIFHSYVNHYRRVYVSWDECVRNDCLHLDVLKGLQQTWGMPVPHHRDSQVVDVPLRKKNAN